MYVRFGRLALGGMLVVFVMVLAACGGSSSSEHASAQKGEPAAEHGESASEREHEAEELKSGHRTLFEADRRPDHTPAAESVENRAYPRSYVETKRALAGRAAVDRARTRGAKARARARTAQTRAATRAA